MITYGYDDAITVSTEWNWTDTYVYAWCKYRYYMYHIMFMLWILFWYMNMEHYLIIFMLFEMILNALVIQDDIQNVNKRELSYRYVMIRCMFYLL